MRRALLVCLVLSFACSPLPTASTHASPAGAPIRAALSSGGVVLYPLPHPAAGCPACSAGSGPLLAGGDGNIWFADPYDHAIGRVTHGGVVTDFPLPGPAFQDGHMARDAAGNIWLAVATDAGAPEVFRVSTTGAITTLSIPGPAIEAIAIGPDGNLWLASGGQVAYLARLTPKGDYKRFPPPEAVGAVVGMSAGLGHLWVLETGPIGTDLFRVETSGSTLGLHLDLPSDFNPSSLTFGSDGNLWLAGTTTVDVANAQLDRITPAGRLTPFPLGTQVNPLGLVTGPDGNLWFVERSAAHLGRMTVEGVLRSLPMPRGFDVDQLAAGPDGRMWFTGAGMDQIGNIGVTVPEPSFVPHVLNLAWSGGEGGTETIRNTGDAVLNITRIQLGGASASQFSVSDDRCTGHALPSGAQCFVAVTASSGAGPFEGNLQVFDNGTDSPQTVWMASGVMPCRLPVYELPTDSQTAPTSAGFLDVLTGVTTQDASGTFTHDPTTGIYQSQVQPVLSGTSPATYDPQQHRWLPTFAAAVSPDGSRYAYTAGAPNSTVHVVDIATGRDRSLAMPTRSWSVLSFATEGIFLAAGYESRSPGLWLVNPDTGVLTETLSSQVVTAVGNGGAWLTAVNPADPHPPVTAMGQPGPDEIVRSDLRTGAVSTWLYMPGWEMGVAMLTGTTVVVEAVHNGIGTMLMMTAPNVAKQLHAPDPSDDGSLWAFPTAVSTAQGIWIPTYAGRLYLWTPSSGLVVVAETHANPAGVCA